MKTNLAFKDINRIPNPTWSWLKMNGSSLEVEADSEVVSERKEIVATKKGEVVRLHFDFSDGKRHECEQTIVAEENAEVAVVMDFESGDAAASLSTVRTTLVAKPYSKIHLIKVQLLGKTCVHIDSTAGECGDSAEISVSHIELGGAKAFVEVKNDLRGFASKFKSDTAYLCKGEQFFDFNYLVSHFGKNSDTKMNVRGVLSDSAEKIYRGTIDFKNGCAGATGDEQEEALLVSPGCINKSIPVILCDEEDVSGTHGSTIGRLGDEELFYFQSRGIDEREANRVMSRAKIMSVANRVPDSELVGKIEAFVDSRFAST